MNRKLIRIALLKFDAAFCSYAFDADYLFHFVVSFSLLLFDTSNIRLLFIYANFSVKIFIFF